MTGKKGSDMSVAWLLERKRTHFVLWRPSSHAVAPKLVIGRYNAGPPPSLDFKRTIDMVASLTGDGVTTTDLWEVPASSCGLTDGDVYHYWFEIPSTNPYTGANFTVRITDPCAYTVDWRQVSDP